MLETDRAHLIEAAIRGADGPAICAYLMAGYPDRDRFPGLLVEVARAADLVEIGVPFTDPMADGPTIQAAGHAALGNGATLEWILDLVAEIGEGLEAPYLLMGYYNPFLAYGLDRLGDRLATASVSGLIVPDLPPEETGPLRQVLDRHRLALISLVTPATTYERLSRIGAEAKGFLYAVTTTGITGGELEAHNEVTAYLGRLREVTGAPVLAGFGVRHRAQVEALAPHVDGVVVGSALIEAIDRGESSAGLIEGLRPRQG